MSGLGEGSAAEGEVSGWKGTRGPFAVNPSLAIVHDLAPGDVVADEIDEIAGRTGDDFLKGFEDECVDEQVFTVAKLPPRDMSSM